MRKTIEFAEWISSQNEYHWDNEKQSFYYPIGDKKHYIETETMFHTFKQDVYEYDEGESKDFCSDSFLSEYKHYPAKQAEEDYDIIKTKKYRVVTINSTFANQTKTDADYDESKPSPNYDEVHRNIYIMTLPQLFQFNEELHQVAETIIEVTVAD